MPILAPARPRLASVQRSTEGASAVVVTRRGNRPPDTQYLSSYQDWQGDARKYARRSPVVRFTSGVTSNVCRRCILQVEERDDNGDWRVSEDPAFRGVFDRYRNPRQTTDELVGLHAWHYGIAGEGAQVIRDGPDGVEWGIFSMAVIEWDRPDKGMALVKLTPDGKLTNDTAFAVPREQVVRFWIPDEEFQALATSPMAASIDTLRRYQTLARRAERTAESQLVMDGILWAPGEGFEVEELDDDDETDDATTPQSPMERAYYETGKLKFDENTNDIAAIVPPLMHWDHEYGPPQWIALGNPLDPNGIAYRKEAFEDYARGTDLPASMVVGGGPGDANHWTEWLVDQKFFDAGVAPTMDRVTHMDMTATFLTPLIQMSGRDPDSYRVGYDPSPVIVKADQSEMAFKMYMGGLLAGDAAFRAANFDENDRMGDDEFAKVLDLVSRGRTVITPTVGNPIFDPHPGGVIDTAPAPTIGPPSNGVQPAPPAAASVAALLASVLNGADEH